MNRREVIGQGRARAPQAPLQAPDLDDAPLETLPRYLTTRELAAYLNYTGKRAQGAAQKFVKRHGLRRRWRSRCVALVLRADVDAVLEGRVPHASHVDATEGRNAT